MEPKFLCIIPARGGSKGVKKKNIRLINGKPLISWTIEEALKSKYIERVIVSTEDTEIADISKSFGAEVVDRPQELALDTSSTMDVIFHALEEVKKQQHTPENIILLQCTSPLRKVRHIDEAILKFIENSESADSLISVSKQEHPPWWLKSLNENGILVDFINYDKMKFTRRQDFPEVFYINGAIYIIKTVKLYEYKSFQTDRTMPYVMKALEAVDIDTEMDFFTAEYLMKRQMNDL